MLPAMSASADTDPAVFGQHLASWREWQASPWGRLRYAVVGHVLDTHLASMGPGLRVLDLGGGDGTESLRLAALGHDVTLVDPSEGMLGVARAQADASGVAGRLTVVHAGVDDLAHLGLGTFDVVLFHFVIHYLADPAAAVAAAAGHVAAGGFLSLIAPNPDADVLVRVRDLDLAGARDLLASGTRESVTFAHAMKHVGVEQARAMLAATGLHEAGHYGQRGLMNMVASNEPKHDPAFYIELERLEVELCGTAPYRDIGASWQLVARRA